MLRRLAKRVVVHSAAELVTLEVRIVQSMRTPNFIQIRMLQILHKTCTIVMVLLACSCTKTKYDSTSTKHSIHNLTITTVIPGDLYSYDDLVVRFGLDDYSAKKKVFYKNDTVSQVFWRGSEGWYIPISRDEDRERFLRDEGISWKVDFADSSGIFLLDGEKLDLIVLRNDSLFCRRGSEYLIFSWVQP